MCPPMSPVDSWDMFSQWPSCTIHSLQPEAIGPEVALSMAQAEVSSELLTFCDVQPLEASD